MGEVKRTRQKEKMNCHAIATEAPAVTMGCSAPGMASQHCSGLRQGGWTCPPMHQSLDMGYPQEGGTLLGKVALFS